jgi:hypothetical protein
VQLTLGDEVFLMNPRSVRQKVASGTISNLSGEGKFHFISIPETWFKINVHEALGPNVTLMFQNEDAEQHKVKDVVGSSAIWDGNYMKGVT